MQRVPLEAPVEAKQYVRLLVQPTAVDVSSAPKASTRPCVGEPDRSAHRYQVSASGGGKIWHRNPDSENEPPGESERTRSPSRGRWAAARLHAPPRRTGLIAGSLSRSVNRSMRRDSPSLD